MLARRALLASLLAGMALSLLAPLHGAAQDPCEDGRNLTFNCQFDTFGPAPGGAVPQGWWPFVISGRPAFDQASDTPKPPSLRIWSDGEGFVAGIYQEVSGTVPGATYEAFIGWAVFASNGDQMGRTIGIDPRGGTDPQAASVVWSQEVWEKKRSNPELRVRAVAEGEKLTVFVRVNHPHSYGADQAFLDAVSLWRDEAAPVATVAVPATATPVPPPTDTATTAPPEATPTETSEPATAVAMAPTLTATATAAATAELPTPTTAATRMATATGTPTATATATEVPTTTPSATARPGESPTSILSTPPTASATATATQPAATAWDLRGGQATVGPAEPPAMAAAAVPVARRSDSVPLPALALAAFAGLLGYAGYRRSRTGG